LDKCTKYFAGDTMAAGNICNKYLMQDNNGNYLESHPDELIERLVNEFERIENTTQILLIEKQFTIHLKILNI